MNNSLTVHRLLRYGILGIPLAFAGLPIYVHVPKFYADTLQVNLGNLGALLLILRLFDAVSDPIIGMVSDRLRQHARIIMIAMIPLLILGYVMVFNPPPWAFLHPMFWLGGCLCLVYFSFSTLMVNYYAMGVNMAQGYNDHTRIASFRESFMLLGVLLASLLPTVLLRWFDVRQAYGIFSLMLAPLLIICAVFCFYGYIPLSKAEVVPQSSFLRLLKNSMVRWVLMVAFCNAIPVAITSTLFLFFTRDVLHIEPYSGPLLALYFLSAAFGMPLWSWLSFRLGKKRSLLIAMITAIICFLWAFALGAGDIKPFAVICILSGMTLGADSMLLPSMLGDALMEKPEATALGFGLWNLINKLTMAFAAGIALPILAMAGYHSAATNSTHALYMLSVCYALLPCVFKLVAVLMLHFSPLDQRKTV